MKKIGILLVNLGTPDAPDPVSVKSYLAEFLSDPRVIQIPKAIWWPILHGIILKIRPKRSAKLYQKIWTETGSPLRTYSLRIAQQLQIALQRAKQPISVALAMRYGEPAVGQVLEELQQQAIERLLILPLFPQYSASTTASVFDAISKYYRKKIAIPEFHMLHDYAEDPNYIAAIATSVEQHNQIHGQPQLLLFSFHGLPQRLIVQGDPYYQQCQRSSQLIAGMLHLSPGQWKMVFQSRFGYEKWLEPYCDQTLLELPQQGIEHVAIVCPGFAADCLETLEEINQQYRKLFINAGGKIFHYVPALNDTPQHIEFLTDLITKQCQAWL